MRGPKPPVVELSPEEQQGLETLVRRYSTPQQLARRGRIILSAAAGLNNSQIAREVGLDVDYPRKSSKDWKPWCEIAREVGLDGTVLAQPLAGATGSHSGRPEYRRKVAGCASSWGSRPDHPRASLPDHVPGL